MPTIRGRIIRILGTTLFVINLGKERGVDSSSIFRILAEPESVTDPVTKEDLGRVQVIKGTLKADKVYDRFTIATSRWRALSTTADLGGLWSSIMSTEGKELNVDTTQIEPWKGLAENPVRIGDYVMVDVASVPSTQEDLTSDDEVEGTDANGDTSGAS